MKLIIDIDEDDYLLINRNNICRNRWKVYDAIKNGTPLLEPHGRLIDVDALIDSLGDSDRDIYCKAVIEENASIII